MTVAPADKVDGAGKEGVVVMKVEPKSAAADRGLKKGDVILEVAGKSVTNPGDVREAIEAARTDKKSSVLMRLRSGDASHYVAVPLATARPTRSIGSGLVVAANPYADTLVCSRTGMSVPVVTEICSAGRIVRLKRCMSTPIASPGGGP